MNYINQIKAFHDLNETNTWTTGQIALWYALMYINNKCYWSEWFSVSNKVLSLHTGLSRQGILKARNALKQAGVIDFKTKGTKSTLYHLCDLISKSSQDSCRSSCQESSQDSCQGSCTLININKTYSDDGDGEYRAREIAEYMLNKYWDREPTESDYASVREKIIHIDTVNRSVCLDEEKVELLEYAFECSAKANALNWNYISGVYERFRARGIERVDDAYQFEIDRRK